MCERFTLLRVEYHQRIEAFLGCGSQKRSLAHCDRAYVLFVDTEAWPDEEIINKIAHKVYFHRIKKNDSFVALLEVNVQDPLAVDKWYESKYCFLTAVVCMPGKNDVICVPLTVNSFLRPSNKCFELTDKNCHQRPYHIISASQTLASYKCLMAPQNGWIFILNFSNPTLSALITANQYVAIGTEQRLYPVSSKGKSRGFYSKRRNLPKELLRNGDGVLVKYGAILAGEPKHGSKEGPSGSFVFIGEFASRLTKFSRIQDRVNLTYSFDKESAWPELPKHNNFDEDEKATEKKVDVDANTMAPTVCEDGQTVSSLDDECSGFVASQAEDLLETKERATEEEQLCEENAGSNALLQYQPPTQVVYVNPWDYNPQLYSLYPMANPICYCNCAPINYYDQDRLE